MWDNQGALFIVVYSRQYWDEQEMSNYETLLFKGCLFIIFSLRLIQSQLWNNENSLKHNYINSPFNPSQVCITTMKRWYYIDNGPIKIIKIFWQMERCKI